MPHKKKNLVYFVVGGKPGYVALLELCLKSLWKHTSRASLDVLVMCESSYKEYLTPLQEEIDHIHITPPNVSHIHVSMRKLDIFGWPGIDAYEKVLFLDCDIVLAGSLLPVFDAMANSEHVVYVVPEDSQWTSHRTKWFCCGDRPYTRSQLHNFHDQRVYVFNGGQFGFFVNETTRRMFEAMSADKEANYDAQHHYYEQSIMNWYLNSTTLAKKQRQVDYSIKKYVYLAHKIAHKTGTFDDIPKGAVIVHFLSGELDYTKKLGVMEEFYSYRFV